MLAKTKGQEKESASRADVDCICPRALIVATLSLKLSNRTPSQERRASWGQTDVDAQSYQANGGVGL